MAKGNQLGRKQASAKNTNKQKCARWCADTSALDKTYPNVLPSPGCLTTLAGSCLLGELSQHGPWCTLGKPTTTTQPIHLYGVGCWTGAGRPASTWDARVHQEMIGGERFVLWRFYCGTSL